MLRNRIQGLKLSLISQNMKMKYRKYIGERDNIDQVHVLRLYRRSNLCRMTHRVDPVGVTREVNMTTRDASKSTMHSVQLCLCNEIVQIQHQHILHAQQFIDLLQPRADTRLHCK